MTAPPPPSATWITPLDPDLDPLAAPDGIRLAVKDCIDVAGVATTAGSPAVAAAAEPAAGRRRLPGRRPGRRRPHRRQGQPARALLRRHRRQPALRHAGEPARPPAGPRRVVQRLRGRRGHRRGRRRLRHRHRRLDPQPGGLLRRRRPQDHARAWCRWTGVRPLAPSLDTVGVLARDVADAGRRRHAARPAAHRRRPARQPHRRPLPPARHRPHDRCGHRLGAHRGRHRGRSRSSCPAGTPPTPPRITVLFGEALIVNDDLWRAPRTRAGRRTWSSGSRSPRPSAPPSSARPGPTASRGATELAEVLGTVGVIVLPTMASYPARVGRHAVAPNPACPAINLAGHPALPLPVPSGGLLPASIQLVAPDHHEPRLLATAAAIEAVASPAPSATAPTGATAGPAARRRAAVACTSDGALSGREPALLRLGAARGSVIGHRAGRSGPVALEPAPGQRRQAGDARRPRAKRSASSSRLGGQGRCAERGRISWASGVSRPRQDGLRRLAAAGSPGRADRPGSARSRRSVTRALPHRPGGGALALGERRRTSRG